jgi:aspartate aminotransferase-like enzyme
LSAFGRRFDPAQPDVLPVLRALMVESAGLDPEAAVPIIARASLRLRELFRTSQPVVIHPGSAAALREIGLRSTVEHRALALIAGPSGEVLADQAEALGKEVLRLRVHPGRSVEPAHLRRFLAGPEVDSVLLVHSEPGAGSIAPLADLVPLVRARRDVMLFVDASATLGASRLETEQWGIDFVLAPSEGPLGMPAGLAFATASPRLVARARTITGRGSQLDFVAQHDAASRGQTLAPVTPALAAVLLRQLERILDAEGLPARWARHEQMRSMVEAWAAVREVRLFAAESRRADAVTTLALGASRSGAEVSEAVVAEGWRVGVGEAGAAGALLGIGHAGDLQPSQLQVLLELLGRIVGSSGATPP